MQARTEIVPNGALIARTRILAGMNKSDMARKAGVPHSSIIRAEQGRGVTPKTALGISKALGMAFDDLFTIKTPDGAGEDSGQPK